MPYPSKTLFPSKTLYPGAGAGIGQAPSEPSPRLGELLDRLPPFMRRDPTTQAILGLAATEFDLLEETMDNLIANFYPQTADLFLEFWERLFKLPVNPPGKNDEQRRSTVVTFLRRMSNGGRGENWVNRLTDLVGTSWSYATNTPGDIKGLVWERFLGTIGTSWEWVTGTADGFVFADPSGLIPISSSAKSILNKVKIKDQESIVQFQVGASAAGQEINAVVKHVEAGKELRATWVNGELVLQKVTGGTASELTKLTAALTNGKRYWLRAWIEGNVFKAQIWESDPTKNNGAAAKFTKEFTLLTTNAETYGAGKEGTAGIRWAGLTNAWLIRQVRIDEVAVVVPDNTLRITIPYEEGSYQALEMLILVRSITPANTAIQVFNDLGFVLGVSQLGVQGF